MFLVNDLIDTKNSKFAGMIIDRQTKEKFTYKEVIQFQNPDAYLNVYKNHSISYCQLFK